MAGIVKGVSIRPDYVYDMPSMILGFIKRPKYAKDKRIVPGMRVYNEWDDEGYFVARKRRLNKGAIRVGTVMTVPEKGIGLVRVSINQ